MLLTVIAVIIFLIPNLFIGNWAGVILSRKFGSTGSSLFQNLLLGFVFISTWLNVWSFFLPVNFYAFIPVVAFCTFIYTHSLPAVEVIRKCLYNFFRTTFGFIAIPIFIVLVAYALLPPQHGDSPGYHFLSIRWIESYKIVPGLANLHGRFGFNSSFFVSSAPFAFTQFTGQALYVLNIVFVCSFYMWLLNKVYLYKDKMWSLVFVFVAITMFRQLLIGISSPTPDVLTSIIICYVFIRIAEGLFLHNNVDDKQSIVFILLICFAFTVKLNSFPLSLVIIFLLLQKELYKNRRSMLFMLIAGCIIILPWLIRNFILTGYLVYPVSATGIFNPDWKVPLDVLRFDKLLINNGPKMISRNWEAVNALSFSQWFPLWIKANFQNGLKGNLILLSVAFLSAVVTIILALQKRVYSLFWLAIITLASISFWIYNSPDYRFGYPYLINAILLFGLLITHDKPLQLRVKQVASLAVTILCVYYLQRAVDVLSAYPVSTYVVRPLQANGMNSKASIASFPFIQMNEKVKLFVEDGTHWCNMSPLPCFQLHYRKLLLTQIELRGDDIEDGFRIKR